MAENNSTYGFLLEAYETEILKTAGIWESFPPQSMDWRPHERSRTVMEQFEHQVQSEARWMKTMLGIDTGEPLPGDPSRDGFIAKYRQDAQQRLQELRTKPDEWWREETMFYDVRRSRAWVMLRRINHSTHHRGQLIVYLRLLDIPVPSVYGPTADTHGQVKYDIAA